MKIRTTKKSLIGLWSLKSLHKPCLKQQEECTLTLGLCSLTGSFSGSLTDAHPVSNPEQTTINILLPRGLETGIGFIGLGLVSYEDFLNQLGTCWHPEWPGLNHMSPPGDGGGGESSPSKSFL